MTRFNNKRFGPVWGASGVEGFYGEGYPFHRLLGLIPGFGFDNMTFVAKTATLLSREGNMPLEGIRPKERFPKCIFIDFWRGIALNAVGLSNPGAEALFSGKASSNQRLWQSRPDPFQLSFMTVSKTSRGKKEEWEMFLGLLDKNLRDFRAPVIGVQKNESCPNVGRDDSHADDFIDEVRANLHLVRDFNPRVKFIIKLSATFPPSKVKFISEHPACWGICVSNTIPWWAKISWLSDDMQIKWGDLFGVDPEDLRPGEIPPSPLQQRGLKEPGGLSGKPLNPIVCAWIKEARNHDVKCHINGGGGILHPRDVNKVLDAGAGSIFLGSIAFLRPWGLQRCIRQAWKIAG